MTLSCAAPPITFSSEAPDVVAATVVAACDVGARTVVVAAATEDDESKAGVNWPSDVVVPLVSAISEVIVVAAVVVSVLSVVEP
mmetsp:Transcript_41950/g.91493  ORF Transcript_41950/g.91493 Transcript_41950/m.91493 type:complete len:84 (-) Transcript_41950:18-269(-)|eukprot:CAMPEP_0170632784 /NCGR_PEP_ID=MMETSP0224-20130122/35543_1 /TAXON_ID=285029 /ORGANISM="Togula jolla, Strain CCCM 725" /LENGTH=83 /DNA_ID=CAMNT_0010961581 /DNA_START=224 /DNA_END=475 /DNA_ORIENTATION=+